MSSDDDTKMATIDDDDDDVKMSISLRAIVTGSEAGSIIGTKGENVKNMREETKAKINIEGSGAEERVITVEGKTDSIFKAYTMICKVLEQRATKEREKGKSTDPEDGLCLKLLVPASQCGALIGKGGEKIKELRSTTGADINICSNPMPGSDEREMKVKGKREEITKLIFHVCSLLLENPPRDEVQLYRPGTGGGDSSRRGGGGGRAMDRIDRGDRERDRDRHFRDSYSYRERDYEQYSRGGGRARREESPSRSGIRSQLDYGVRDTISRAFGPRSSSSSYGAAASPFDAIMEFARRHDSGRRGGGGREEMFEMLVSNDKVGAVIGRQGSKINEIRTLSGASINITESGKKGGDRRDGNDPDRERVVEITGTTEQVALAKSLINVAVDLADGDDRRGDDRGRRGGDRDRSRSRDRNSRYDDRRRW